MTVVHHIICAQGVRPEFNAKKLKEKKIYIISVFFYNFVKNYTFIYTYISRVNFERCAMARGVNSSLTSFFYFFLSISNLLVTLYIYLYMYTGLFD